MNTIENLAIEESPLGRSFAARRQHLSTTGKTLAYTIVQTTELSAGRVTRQINVFDPDA